jgi:signal peptidase I
MTAATDQPFRKSQVREFFESICVAVILAFFVRTFVVQAFKIPTGSMEPNLLIGDHLLVNKFVFAPTLTSLERTLLPIAPIRRGDIMVFKYPEDPSRDFIKRVIGLPGDTIEMRNKKVYVNGKPLDEPYAHFIDPPAEAAPGAGASGAPDVEEGDRRQGFALMTVPADKYFMMGDNRDNSEDSRWWGFLDRDHVKGKALFIYFSFGEGGGLANIRWSRLLHQIH